jgi:glutathione S-transferase
MLHQIIDEFDAVLWAVTRKSLYFQEHPDYQGLGAVFKREYKNNLDRLSYRMSGPFLIGDEITVPDLILAHCGDGPMSQNFQTIMKSLMPILNG